MKHIDGLVVSADFRSRVQALADRLGRVRVVAAPGWQYFVTRLDLGDRQVTIDNAPALVVGTPAAVLRHAGVEPNEFGFVMPSAQIARWWQRAPAWRDDVTLDLWRAGWSPLDVDRITISHSEAAMEFVIGNVRRTPTPGAGETSSR